MPKEPLFPHQPRRRQPQFPHRSASQVTPQEGLEAYPATRIEPGQIVFVKDIHTGKYTQPAIFTGRTTKYRLGSQRWTGQVLRDPETGVTFSEPYYEIRRERDVTQQGEIFKMPLLIEAGEKIPPQYRNLVDYIDEPLPEYALMAVEVVEGERKIDAVLRSLKGGVEAIQQSENFRQFLTTMSKFHDYSIGNQILIMVQKPEATRVAGFNTWKELGRWVKRGETGISILAPRFPPRPICPKCGARIPKGAKHCPNCGAAVEEAEAELEPAYFIVVSVFDISQTEGKPLPEFEIPVLTGDVNEQLFTKVMALARSEGLEVSFESRPFESPSIKGQYSGKSIWVRPEEARSQQLKTLLHELSHYYSEGVFRIARRDAETIAESAAYVVGAHYGFDTGVRSFSYVALWAADEKVLKENLGAIRRVATTILEGLEKA